MIKKGVKTIVDVAVSGIAMGQVGTSFTGNLVGLGRATQVVIGAGVLSRAMPKRKRKK